jgi:hypothetical protein
MRAMRGTKDSHYSFHSNLELPVVVGPGQAPTALLPYRVTGGVSRGGWGEEGCGLKQ